MCLCDVNIIMIIIYFEVASNLALSVTLYKGDVNCLGIFMIRHKIWNGFFPCPSRMEITFG